MLKSSMHKSKEIVTISEFITMVQDQNWKKDVSYILVEEIKENKWRETGLIPASQAHDLRWNSEKGHLTFYTRDLRIDLNPVTEGTRIQDLVDSDDDTLRYTVYMT